MESQWIERALTLTAEIVIVVLFLKYLVKRDALISEVSRQCHEVSEAGHAAIKDLATAVARLNGKRG